MNEKGSSLIFGISLLLILVSVVILYLNSQIIEINKIKSKNNLFLCAKEHNGITRNFIKKINQINSYLKILSATNFISIMIPQVGLITKASLKKTIKIMKLKQLQLTFSYIYQMNLLRIRTCPISKSTFLTPIKLNGKSIKRNNLNEALYRRKTWSDNLTTNQYIIINKFTSSGKAQSYLIKKGRPLSRVLSWFH